jgi:hypothetical protein
MYILEITGVLVANVSQLCVFPSCFDFRIMGMFMVVLGMELLIG